MAESVLMKLSDLAAELGFSVPAILPRIVPLDSELFCANPGAIELSPTLEAKIRAELVNEVHVAGTQKIEANRPKRRASKAFRRKSVVRTTIRDLAVEYGLAPEELLRTAHSMGFGDLSVWSKISDTQLAHLYKALNPQMPTTFGDSSEPTLTTALQNATPLRDSGTSTKRRATQNSGRIRVSLLAKNWNCSEEAVSEACKCSRVEILGEDIPRISISDVENVFASLVALGDVRKKWGDREDIRLSKVAAYLGVSLSIVRELCISKDVMVGRRDHVATIDAAFILVAYRRGGPSLDGRIGLEPDAPVQHLATETQVAAVARTLILNGMNLEDQDFSNTDLQGVSFVACNLIRAKFVKADLRGVDFSDANLRYATFDNAVIEGACFTRADLRWANFQGTAPSVGQFAEAIIEGAVLPSEESAL